MYLHNIGLLYHWYCYLPVVFLAGLAFWKLASDHDDSLDEDAVAFWGCLPTIAIGVAALILNALRTWCGPGPEMVRIAVFYAFYIPIGVILVLVFVRVLVHMLVRIVCVRLLSWSKWGFEDWYRPKETLLLRLVIVLGGLTIVAIAVGAVFYPGVFAPPGLRQYFSQGLGSLETETAGPRDWPATSSAGLTALLSEDYDWIVLVFYGLLLWLLVRRVSIVSDAWRAPRARARFWMLIVTTFVLVVILPHKSFPRFPELAMTIKDLAHLVLRGYLPTIALAAVIFPIPFGRLLYRVHTGRRLEIKWVEVKKKDQPQWRHIGYECPRCHYASPSYFNPCPNCRTHFQGISEVRRGLPEEVDMPKYINTTAQLTLVLMYLLISLVLGVCLSLTHDESSSAYHWLPYFFMNTAVIVVGVCMYLGRYRRGAVYKYR